MENSGTIKRFVFTLDAVDIYDMKTNSRASTGEVNHQSRLYTYSEFIEPNFALLLTHVAERSRIWHERLWDLNFRYMKQLRNNGMVYGLPENTLKRKQLTYNLFLENNLDIICSSKTT
jgi:hypothetical protein